MIFTLNTDKTLITFWKEITESDNLRTGSEKGHEAEHFG